MSMIEATKVCFAKYTQFNGRARRPELWWFILFHYLVVFGPFIIGGLIFGAGSETYLVTLFVSTGFLLVTALPWYAVLVRRLHDTNRSGWSLFVMLIPLLGVFILIAWLASVGDEGENRFGPVPQ